MHVLTFASQKGGSGKTTLAGHVAVQAARAGAGRVCLVDTDPQGSLADWWNAREAPTPEFVHTAADRLRADLATLQDLGIDLVVIDTPPAITATIEEVIAASDLVAIPTRPSPHDLRAAGATVELVETAGKPLVFVVNAATQRARITGEAAVALSQHGTVAPATLHQRTDFAASMIDGRTVMETAKAERSSAEVRELWRYLSARLLGTRRETILTEQPPRPAKTPVIPARAATA
jgi:chromosome partitioning protein